jgi:hypothetical protein
MNSPQLCAMIERKRPGLALDGANLRFHSGPGWCQS